MPEQKYRVCDCQPGVKRVMSNIILVGISIGQRDKYHFKEDLKRVRKQLDELGRECIGSKYIETRNALNEAEDNVENRYWTTAIGSLQRAVEKIVEESC